MFAHFNEKVRKSITGLPLVRDHRKRRFIQGARILQGAQLMQHVGQVQLGRGIMGKAADGLLINFARRFMEPEIGENNAKIEIGGQVINVLELDIDVSLLRLLKPANAGQELGPVKANLKIGGLAGETLLGILECFFDLTIRFPVRHKSRLLFLLK